MAEPFYQGYPGHGKLPHYPMLNHNYGFSLHAQPDQTEPMIWFSTLIDGEEPLVGVQLLTARDVAVLCGELQKCLRHAEWAWLQNPSNP